MIELDGSQHGEDASKAKDDQRTRWLRIEGYRVLRFWNNDIRENLDGVLDTIHAALYGSRDIDPVPLKHLRRKRLQPHPGAPSAPTLPPPGEGEREAMPDLLLEFFSEEIPARMQARAADDLKKMVTDRLVAAGLTYEGAKAFATPRRLALTVQGMPARQPDLKEERKGPKVGAPEQAIAGFLRAAGLTSIDQAKVQADKKGDFYVAITEKPGQETLAVLATMIPEIVRSFPWPKSMRWGASSAQAGSLSWVRPLHSIVATFGPETEEPVVVPFDIDGIKGGDDTRGHRFLAPGAFKVKRFDDYVAEARAMRKSCSTQRAAWT